MLVYGNSCPSAVTSASIPLCCHTWEEQVFPSSMATRQLTKGTGRTFACFLESLLFS